MHFSNLKNSILSTVKDFCGESEAVFLNVQLHFESRFVNVKITAVKHGLKIHLKSHLLLTSALRYPFLNLSLQVAEEEIVSKVTVWEQMDQFARREVTAVSQLSRATDKPAPSGRLLLLHTCSVSDQVPKVLGTVTSPAPLPNTHTPKTHKHTQL